MTLVKCSTKPGYCKHQHSSILHSFSSKGKLLALIECETNLFSLSLYLFLSLSLLVLLGAVISLTILEGQEAFERSLRTYTLQGEIGLFRPQIHVTILLSQQISVWVPLVKTRRNPRPKEPTLGKRIRHYLGFPERTFWPIDSFRNYDQIFNVFFSRINSQMKKHEARIIR